VTKNPALISGLLLGLFALVGTSLVAYTHTRTKDRIAANERAALLKNMAAIVPAESIDNDPSSDVIFVRDPERLGGETTSVYRGRKDGEPVAVIIDTLVPDGYAGPIKLLVAVEVDGTLSGVRVLSHKETPGLGDKIDEEKSDWVTKFTGKSLTNPKLDDWRVKRDGGVFDQFTGATITPRSIVKAVKNTLLFVQEQGDRLYAPAKTELTEAQQP